MNRSIDRILTTHTGSLIRPAEVVDTLRRPQPDSDVLDRAVYDVVARQQQAGIDVVGDGEYGKPGFATYILNRLSGFTAVDGIQNPAFTGRDRAAFPDVYAELDTQAAAAAGGGGPGLSGGISPGQAAYACTGPVAYTGHGRLVADLDRLNAATAAAGVAEAFYPATSPGTIVQQRPNHHYPDDDDYLAAVTAAMAVEYRTVADAGLILQIDDPRAATGWDSWDPPPDPAVYRRTLHRYVEALNHALAGVPPEQVRYHVCWGSWHGPHTTDIPLADIVDVVLQVNAQAYMVEAANPRHAHEWHVWEDVELPDGKIVIPGVVTHSTPVVEHPEVVADRICDFAITVGRDRVIAGTDCGFAQGFTSRRVHEQVQWAKLRALSEGAQIATSRLWPA